MATIIPKILSDSRQIQRHPLAGKWSDPKPDTRRHLLALRFSLFNIVAAAFLAAAYVHGYIDMVIAADQTRLSVVIFLVFCAGLVLCGIKVADVSRELNRVRAFNPGESSQATAYLAKLGGIEAGDRAVLAGALRLRLSHRIVVVHHIANSLVLLGLVGTVIGFIIALAGVDPQKAANFEAISPMVSALIRGMSTALYTTLVGGVLNLWLTVNYHLLATGTVKLITAIQELGARGANPAGSARND